jgi:hypothetical protein
MRIIILLIGLLFFGCKTLQFNTEYTIDYSDKIIVGNCGTYVHKSKITKKPLDGLYKVVSGRKVYSISKYQKGLLQFQKTYWKGKLWHKQEQLKSDTSIYVRYNNKYTLLSWSDSKPYDSIQEYRTKHYNNYPVKVNVFFEGNSCQYTFDYDALAGRLKIVVTGCELEYAPVHLEHAILNTECNNNPLTFNTKYGKFNNEITVEIINKNDTIHNYFELNEDRYIQKF